MITMTTPVNPEEMDYKQLLELQKRISEVKKDKKDEYRLEQNQEEIEKRLDNIGSQIEKLKELGSEKDKVIQAIEEWILAYFG